jgi:O-antigen/teichoic acid export membrane protein
MLLAFSWLAPAAVVLGVGSWLLIPIVYGEAFAPARATLLALLPGFVIAQTLFWARPTLFALGRPATHMRVNFLVMVLKIVLVLTLVRPFGHVVDAAVLSFLFCVSSGLAAAIAWRELASQRGYEAEQGAGAMTG